ncbi:hypothetical protein [Magnetococcus sp. PR-3]|uniref:hypothetical protein n=1 Tax=Magnetococcus sp. PR-3 TaxID=3120355 RepID=UPI002FCE005E
MLFPYYNIGKKLVWCFVAGFVLTAMVVFVLLWVSQGTQPSGLCQFEAGRCHPNGYVAVIYLLLPPLPLGLLFFLLYGFGENWWFKHKGRFQKSP